MTNHETEDLLDRAIADLGRIRRNVTSAKMPYSAVLATVIRDLDSLHRQFLARESSDTEIGGKGLLAALEKIKT